MPIYNLLHHLWRLLSFLVNEVILADNIKVPACDMAAYADALECRFRMIPRPRQANLSLSPFVSPEIRDALWKEPMENIIGFKDILDFAEILLCVITT